MSISPAVQGIIALVEMFEPGIAPEIQAGEEIYADVKNGLNPTAPQVLVTVPASVKGIPMSITTFSYPTSLSGQTVTLP